MKEPLITEKIKKELLNGDLSKENAEKLLISLIENSDKTDIRIESIKILESLKFQDKNLFKILENNLISDDNEYVRASVVHYFINHYQEESVSALRWVIKNDRSPLVLRTFFDFINKFKTTQMKLIKKDLISWSKNFSSKIGVNPQEAIFFLDLEVLFAKGKKNYELDPLTYKHFEQSSDFKNGEPWLVIKNKHVEILNFNYFNWKFIKNNIDIVNSLSKLQDLDIYLCSLRKYQHNDVAISSIPESIGSLIHLRKLILRRNNLKKLPISMKKLTLLKELDISYNKFKEIPEVISSLNILETLNIKHNFIQSIPGSLSHYIKVIR